MFPDFYILSLQQMDTVAQVWSPQGWDLIFRRALNDWEVDRVAGLLHTLNAFPGVTESPDTPIWKMRKKGIFSVKSCYWSLNSNQAMEMEWPWKLIWKIKVPHKVSGFIWLAIREACLTHEVLQRRGIQICSRCFMCGEEAQVNSHLFLHYRTAANLWNMFLCILGVNWVMPKTTSELLRQWEGVGRRRRSKLRGNFRLLLRRVVPIVRSTFTSLPRHFAMVPAKALSFIAKIILAMLLF
ncbi:hypothetical protein MTR67_024751 [Solanum verrucosum]|uniref:Reverse transcriptase zinc-binding domain-containing protein n=1 Tax=Solanum verrucosum TaxID=315347 RepID=A0AAF0QXJ7_SOLVR|nr:hypothetical protein MTR67_024751 [Solanum verrucosum]